MTALDKLISDHNEDDQCIVDPKTECCIVCHVYHGEPCDLCDGRGFHAPSCPTLNGYEVPAEDSNIGGYPPIGPGRLMYTALALLAVAWILKLIQ